MQNNQTFILNVNPKNGTVVIPKKARQKLNIGTTVYLKISGDQAILSVPQYSLEDVLYNLPPIKPTTTLKENDIKEIAKKAAVKRFLKSDK